MNTRFEFREEREVLVEPRVEPPIRPSWLVPIGEVDPATLARQAESLAAAALAATHEEASAEASASAGRLFASIGRLEDAMRWLARAANTYEDRNEVIAAAVQKRRLAEVARLRGRARASERAAIDAMRLFERAMNTLPPGDPRLHELRREWVRTIPTLAERSIEALRDIDDAHLLERWKAADSHAGGELFRRYWGEIAAYFQAKAPNAVDDLVQETFARFVESRDRIRANETFRTFLYRIARYCLVEHLRRNFRSPQLLHGRDVTMESDAVEAMLDEFREHHRLAAALEQLPIDDQDLLELHYWRRLTSHDLAQLLRIHEGTVRSRIHAARQRLAKAYRTLADEGDEVSEREIEQWLEAVRDRRQGSGTPSAGA